MELGKIPPHDIEAEQAILGSMLTDKDAVITGIEILKPEDFYRNDNSIIFEAMLNLYNKAEEVDLITVKSELESMGKFDKIGGIEYLAELPEKVPTTANVEKYAKIVEEKAGLRNLIKTANEIIELGYDPTEDLDDIMAGAEKKIIDLMQNKNQKGYSKISDILVNTVSELEELYNQKKPISGISTGYPDLDRMTAGLQKSELILLAARPGMGKSALALNIATNVALKENIPVVIFNMEMSKEQLVKRILSSEAMIDSNKLKTGKLDAPDWANLADAMGIFADAGIYIDDTADITATDIRSKCRKLKLEKNIGLIVIDYLQLIKANSKKNATREQEISEISRALKILAKETNVPVIALSQLSRSIEQRAEHRPMLSDLRESGSIEQDADIVMFLYRDEVYNPESPKKNMVEVIIEKNRSGTRGSIDLGWIGKHTKFVNLERRFDD